MADSDKMQRQLLRGQQSEQREETFEGTSNGSGTSNDFSDSDSSRLEEQWRSFTTKEENQASQCGRWWDIEPDVGRVAHGVPKRVDRLKCLGNSVVPQIPFVIGLAIKETIENE
jgi:DNA (cytosine-5)-methyltransferase 1